MKTLALFFVLILVVIFLSGCAGVAVYDKDGQVIGHTAPVAVRATVVQSGPLYVVPVGYHRFPRYESGSYRRYLPDSRVPKLERKVERLERRVRRMERE